LYTVLFGIGIYKFQWTLTFAFRMKASYSSCGVLGLALRKARPQVGHLQDMEELLWHEHHRRGEIVLGAVPPNRSPLG
jgi:hypothetical protein